MQRPRYLFRHLRFLVSLAEEWFLADSSSLGVQKLFIKIATFID
jgi:hypothetical protein